MLHHKSAESIASLCSSITVSLGSTIPLLYQTHPSGHTIPDGGDIMSAKITFSSKIQIVQQKFLVYPLTCRQICAVDEVGKAHSTRRTATHKASLVSFSSMDRSTKLIWPTKPTLWLRRTPLRRLLWFVVSRRSMEACWLVMVSSRGYPPLKPLTVTRSEVIVRGNIP